MVSRGWLVQCWGCRLVSDRAGVLCRCLSVMLFRNFSDFSFQQALDFSFGARVVSVCSPVVVWFDIGGFGCGFLDATRGGLVRS